MDHKELQKRLTGIGCANPAVRGDNIWVQSYFMKREIVQMLVEALESSGKNIRILGTRELALLAGHPYEKDRHLSPEFILNQIRAKSAAVPVSRMVH